MNEQPTGSESGQPPHKEVPCAYCNGNVVGTAFVVCAACEIPLHRDCWNESGRCPAYACGSDRVVDPAIALFRKPQAGSFTPAPTPTPPPASQAPATPPAASSQADPGDPPADQPSKLGTLTKILASDKKISAISIDLHLGDSWLVQLRQLWPFGRRAPVEGVAVPTQALTVEDHHEIEIMEREIAGLRLRRWIHRIGVFAGVVLAPVLLKTLGKMYFFPIVIALAVWATWPGWRTAEGKRRERALQERLDRISP